MVPWNWDLQYTDRYMLIQGECVVQKFRLCGSLRDGHQALTRRHQIRASSNVRRRLIAESLMRTVSGLSDARRRSRSVVKPGQRPENILVSNLGMRIPPNW